MRNVNVRHLIHSGVHPNKARCQGATHHFKVQVQGKCVSALTINFPADIRMRSPIEVTNKSGQKIESQVSVND